MTQILTRPLREDKDGIEGYLAGPERLATGSPHDGIHPLIIAELALGSLKERAKTLALLDLLPQVRVARLNELHLMIEARRLYSLGIGLIDAHLIASALIDSPRAALLWTRDKRLRQVGENLGIHARLP